MVKDGLVDEVKILLDAGYRRDLDVLLTLGYREAVLYIDGKSTMEEMIENIKRNTRKYAKRQLTWFQNQLEAMWINVCTGESPKEIAKRIAEELGD